MVKNRFKPGANVGKHYHTGPALAVTLTIIWHYAEYPDKLSRDRNRQWSVSDITP